MRDEDKLVRIASTGTDIEARIEFHAAEVHEAPRLHADIGKPNGLPEAHRNSGPQTAQAHRQVGVIGIGPARGPDVQPADRDREQARPADVGDRVDKASGAASRTGIGHRGRCSGETKNGGQHERQLS